MMKKIFVFLFYYLFSCLCDENGARVVGKKDRKQGELIAVALIYRHGDRTPMRPYAKDPFQNESFWPVGFGQLTNKGKERHFELGKWFRTRYSQLLPDKYNEKDIYVRSTDVDRTLMSAGVNLAGLYYPTNSQIWNPDILWQPIPIHTIPENLDALLAMKKPCPSYDNLFKKLKQSEEIKNINIQNQDLYKYLSEKSGEKIKSPLGVNDLYNTLDIENNFNFTLPEWTKIVYPDRMKSLASFSFSLPCYNKNLARLKAGPFIAEIIENFSNATREKRGNHKKLWMYSAHDITIANILQTLGLFEHQIPPYTSTVIFELYSQGEKNFYINIFYKNSSIPIKMKLHYCDFDCPLEQFKEVLEPVTLPIEKWEEECKLSFLSYLPFEHYQSVFVLSSLGVLVLFLSILLIGLVCVKQKSSQRQHFTYFRIPDRDENV